MRVGEGEGGRDRIFGRKPDKKRKIQLLQRFFTMGPHIYGPHIHIYRYIFYHPISPLQRRFSQPRTPNPVVNITLQKKVYPKYGSSWCLTTGEPKDVIWSTQTLFKLSITGQFWKGSVIGLSLISDTPHNGLNFVLIFACPHTCAWSCAARVHARRTCNMAMQHGHTSCDMRHATCDVRWQHTTHQCSMLIFKRKIFDTVSDIVLPDIWSVRYTVGAENFCCCQRKLSKF